jgi:hypothetical protein
MSTLSIDQQADAARRWWRSLQPLDVDGLQLPGDRATLARLRRCSSPFEAATEPATAQLFKSLGFSTRFEDQLGRAATLAAILAHVRNQPKPMRRIAEAIGAPAGADANEARHRKRQRFGQAYPKLDRRRVRRPCPHALRLRLSRRWVCCP